MNRLNNAIARVFLYLSPVAFLVFMSDRWEGLSRILDSTWLRYPVAVAFLLWIIFGMYFFSLLVLSSKAREKFVTQLANLNERDEREELIVGQASRKTFLFMLALLIALFFVSTLRIGRGVEERAGGRYMSFTMGHWGLIDSPKEAGAKDSKGVQEKIQIYDLPLTKTGLLLVLSFCHLGAFFVSARRPKTSKLGGILVLIAGIWVGMSSGTAQANTVERISGLVRSSSGLSCQTYLFSKTGSHQLPLVLSMNGTGIYSNDSPDWINDALVDDYKAGRIAVLTFNKPGLSPDPADPKGHAAIVDVEMFNRHTQLDLVSCAEEAIEWALKQEPVKMKDQNIYLFGHSEGAQISVRFYAKLILDNRPLGKQIQALFLTGLPMTNWKQIIQSQLNREPKEESERFWKAYDSCDEPSLKKGSGTPCAYLHDILAEESDEALLEKLWDAKPTALFQVFHGLNDENTDVKPVMAFEKLNRQRRLDQKPFLRWSSRYYLAGHGLNFSAADDMQFALEYLLAQELR